MLSKEQIISDTAQTLVKAGSSYRLDQVAACRRAKAAETSPAAEWVLGQLLENAYAAEQDQSPLCDDTGIPHLFLEIGDQAELPAGFMSWVEAGVAQGLRQLPGRPMAVRGDALQRISQELGMYEDPALLLPAPWQLRHIPGRQIKLTVLMLGGGPEIRGKTQRVFHKHSLDVVKAEMVAWAKEGAALLGCQPCVLFFGIGRSNAEAAALVVEAMKEADFNQQSPLEREINAAVNATGIGPLGLGGSCTSLATFVKVGPQRASGVRIVSLRVGCCVDPRRATVVWE